MCQEPDSAGHILGGCLHKYPKGMIIKRHNEAVWELHKTISADTQGGHFTIVDAGLLDHNASESDTDSESSTTPDNEDDEASQSDGTTEEAQKGLSSAPSTRYADSANPLNTPEDLDHTLGTRIPKDMLPDIDDDIRMKLRPDILKVKGLQAGTTTFPISKDQRATYEI